MGRGISFEAAKAGMTTMLHDVSDASLKEAADYIEFYAGKSVDKEILSESEAQALRSRIHYTSSLQEAVKHADIIIEAVLERMDLKISIFQQADQYAPPEAVIASNTSTMSPTEMAAQTGRPDQCLAMHFFNPVPKMKLIEVIRGLETSDETVQKAKELAAALNKTPVEVNEFPGFAVSRMNCLIGNETMTMVMEGVASIEDVDTSMKLGLNHPMGPLELADLVGLDTRLRNMEYLHQTLGEKYRPCPILVKYVKAGRLGRKTGRGFYEYEKGGKA